MRKSKSNFDGVLGSWGSIAEGFLDWDLRVGIGLGLRIEIGLGIGLGKGLG